MPLTSSTLREQQLLRFSIGVIVLVAATSIAFGLWSGSKAILFDGFYNFIDAVMTVIGLMIVRLITRGADERFQYGYWHLEPLMGLVSGALLATTCAYALANGIVGLKSGGGHVSFGAGATFTGFISATSLFMFFYIRREAANIHSEFLRIDAAGWLMGGMLGAGLCVGFGIAKLMEQTQFAPLAPLVDPVILILVSLCLIPFPLMTLWRGLRDILKIAPADLYNHVQEIVDEVAKRHGFVNAICHVARSGRQQFIEVGLVADEAERTISFAELDQIRQEIAEGLGGRDPGYWLTVDFTADRKWV